MGRPVALLLVLLAGCAAPASDVAIQPPDAPRQLPVVHVDGVLRGLAEPTDHGELPCPPVYRYGLDPDARVLWLWDGPAGHIPEDATHLLVFSVDVDHPHRPRGCENLNGILPVGQDPPRLVHGPLRAELPVRFHNGTLHAQDRDWPIDIPVAVEVEGRADGIAFHGTLAFTHLGNWSLDHLPLQEALPGASRLPPPRLFHLFDAGGVLLQEGPGTLPECRPTPKAFRVDLHAQALHVLAPLPDASILLYDHTHIDHVRPTQCGPVAHLVDGLRLGRFPDGPTLHVATERSHLLLEHNGALLRTGDVLQWDHRHQEGAHWYNGTLSLTYHGLWNHHQVHVAPDADALYD